MDMATLNGTFLILNMASLNGTWKLSEVENFDAYLDAIGVGDETKEKATKLLTAENDIIQEISIGDEVVIKTKTPLGDTSETKGKIGEAIDTKYLDCRDVKTVFHIDGETLVEEQTGAFTATITRKVEGDQMIMNKHQFVHAFSAAASIKYEEFLARGNVPTSTLLTQGYGKHTPVNVIKVLWASS